MSIETMLARAGLTREQVQRAARKCGRKIQDDAVYDEGRIEEGDDLTDAILENRPGYMSDHASGVDASYHGSLMND